jgi:hypothetical protein
MAASTMEKEHIAFALQSLMTVASAALGSQSLSGECVKEVHQRGRDLLKSMEEKKIEPNRAVSELKKLIVELNKGLPFGQAQFPPFATDYLENQVKNNAVAFELFLNHKLKAGLLTLEQENPLFADSLLIWRDVGGKLNPKEGMVQLAKLIHKANSYLPDSEKFPMPDGSKY